MSNSRTMRLIFVAAAICLISDVSAQGCSSAPTNALKIICEQLTKMDKNARATNAKRPMAAAGAQPDALIMPNSPPSCMDMGCLCPFIGGTSCQKAVRKEYRRLSAQERNKFHAAMNQLKQSGGFSEIANIHSQLGTSSGAHAGPAFLPWHREYIKRLEIALRQVDPDVSVPYWDSVLDQNLPDPRDSIIWTSDFFGESDSVGNVINGPFGSWRTVQGRDSILRHVGSQGSLFTEDELNTVLRQSAIDRMLSFTTPGQDCPYQIDFTVLEFVHGNAHIWVGGDMLDQSTSANDPTFFLHHAFVDLIWQRWRETRQGRSQREQDYPDDSIACSNQQHFRDAQMLPFEGYRNIDGLSNKYTDDLYQYDRRPTCSSNRPDCGSPYLFCDRSHGQPRCVSKAKLGGRCDGFEQEDICYEGACFNGRCVPGANPIISTTIPPRRSPPSSSDCWNEHPCCERWSSMGRCQADPIFVEENCRASCQLCQPSFDPSNECSDHHRSCDSWSTSGECDKNPLWMAENCRQSCGLCGRSRHCRRGRRGLNFWRGK